MTKQELIAKLNDTYAGLLFFGKRNSIKRLTIPDKPKSPNQKYITHKEKNR